MTLQEYVAQQIKELRLSYNSGEGLSQEGLAKHLDVAPNTISRWETGVYCPSLQDLEKIARFFGVTIMRFFPSEEEIQDDRLLTLLRTARQLHQADLEELTKYAEFRRARSMYKGKSRPKAGRKRRT
ncbi:MAG TPA: helix-turn-helix transcriptional regulator [Pyrinomonadaceae bacterium]|nr:helix-turn-helix transcriptional regulator [Pyrinomonadaceae bacterium]